MESPVVLAEAGFASNEHALAAPWTNGPYQAPRKSVRLNRQAEGWRALLEELWRREFVWGVYAWKWPPNHTWGGPTNADHTPEGKPALDVIRSYHTKPPPAQIRDRGKCGPPACRMAEAVRIDLSTRLRLVWSRREP
jgi:hypothetical protein